MQRYQVSNAIEQTAVTSPRFYYCRGKKSDRNWIESRLIEIPEDKKQAICDEYERRYNECPNGNRRGANTYLNAVATEYRQENYVKDTKKRKG